MRSLFFSVALVVLGFASSGSQALAQTAPYNPDSNGNGVILTPDLMDLLTLFGQPFTPSPVCVDGVPLETAVVHLQQTVAQQQATIAALIGAVEALLAVPAGQGPFVRDAETGKWVATEPLHVSGDLSTGRLITGRIEARSAQFGGMSTH